MTSSIIRVHHLGVRFGQQEVLKELDLDIVQGEVIGIVGGSGCGKSTLLRCLIHLQEPHTGTIEILGTNIRTADSETLDNLRKHWGVLFQGGALFSALTVLENVVFALKKHTQLSTKLQYELARLKISLAGLTPDAADKYPAELSGGMVKRAALARAIALDPDILFLDEPNAGLDPISAGALDDLILDLRATLGLTVVVVTHDLASLQRFDRVAFLGEGRVLEIAPLKQLRGSQQKSIHAYFNTVRMHLLTGEANNG